MARHESRLGSRRLTGLNKTRGKSLGDQMRLVPSVELVAQILDVTLHGSRRDAQLLRALLGRQALGDTLQHFALAVRQCEEIGCLTGCVHSRPPCGKTLSSFPF